MCYFEYIITRVIFSSHDNSGLRQCRLTTPRGIIASISGQNYEDVAIDLMNASVSTKSGLSSVSPNCWISAMQLVSNDNTLFTQNDNLCSASAGTNFCAKLGNHQQQMLAMELTKCHLLTAGRLSPVSCLPSMNNGKAVSYDISSCLSSLNGFDFTSYTQFYLYVNEICQRLTDSLIIQKKIDASLMFEQRAMEMEENMKRMSSHLDDAQTLLNNVLKLKSSFVSSVGSPFSSLYTDLFTLDVMSAARSFWLYFKSVPMLLGGLLFARLFIPSQICIMIRRWFVAVASTMYGVNYAVLKLYEIRPDIMPLTSYYIRMLLYTCIVLGYFIYFFVSSKSKKSTDDNKKEFANILQNLRETIRKVEEKIEWEAESRRRENDRLLWQLAVDKQAFNSQLIAMNPAIKKQDSSTALVSPCNKLGQSSFELVPWETIQPNVDGLHTVSPYDGPFWPVNVLGSSMLGKRNRDDEANTDTEIRLKRSKQ